MKYLGGKSRISKRIVSIMLRDRKEGQAYIEPFVGGGSVIENVSGHRIGADADPLTIAALKMIQRGDMPPRVTEEDYRDMIEYPQNWPDGVRGWAQVVLSFAGKRGGGWARDSIGGDYYAMAIRNAEKQRPKLKGAEFVHSCYSRLDIPPGSIVYCDPPYQGTKGYRGTGKLDHSKFYDWVRELVGRGSIVYISEYSAPEDFRCIWAKAQNVTLDNREGFSEIKRVATERLFKHESQVSFI